MVTFAKPQEIKDEIGCPLTGHLPGSDGPPSLSHITVLQPDRGESHRLAAGSVTLTPQNLTPETRPQATAAVATVPHSDGERLFLLFSLLRDRK